MALGKLARPRDRDTLCRPIRPCKSALGNSRRSEQTRSCSTAADSSTRLAGSYPSGTAAPPRQVPREPRRRVRPASTLSTGEEAATWRREAGETMTPGRWCRGLTSAGTQETGGMLSETRDTGGQPQGPTVLLSGPGWAAGCESHLCHHRNGSFRGS